MKSSFFHPILLIACLALTACQGEPPAVDNVIETESEPVMHVGMVVSDFVESGQEAFRLVQVADGLHHPWGLAFLPDGRMLVTERAGTMSVVEDGRLHALDGLPDIRPHRQGGLLDVQPHPDHDENGWIYFTFSAPGAGGVGTALARGRLDGTSMTDVETLYSMEPKTEAGAHFGSRILFLGDGTLLFTIGDRGDPDRAQDTQDPAGGTIRLNDDGTIPQDNPFVDDPNVLDETYTYGNRNSQGMALHPETGQVWQTEHGPRGGDELNLIQPGSNYGWPVASGGRDYRSQEQIGVPHNQAPEGIVHPVHQWTPSIAPSGLLFYTGDAFPNWQGDLFVGALAHELLLRVTIENDAVVEHEPILEGEIGRIRDVVQGPDGYIYLLNDEEEAAIFRLEPVEEAR